MVLEDKRSYFSLQKKLESILSEKPEENAGNGEVFDREAYLRDIENFEDIEVVVAGRNSVKIDRKHVSVNCINYTN